MMQCYLCGNREFTLITERLRYEEPRAVYRCNRCGLVFLHPTMTPEEERAFYEKEYGEIFSKEKGTTPENLFEARSGDARMYRDWVSPFLDREDDCLEIGCASGYFLMAIREQVRSIHGMEPHAVLNRFCREMGISMIPDLAACRDGRFTKIFMFFLLEHLGDPAGLLAEAGRVLRPGGKLFIVVPNVEDALLSLYEIPAFRDFYYTPAHQFYYSKKTLSDLLVKSGFSRFGILPRQRYDLSNHMHWMQYGKPGGTGRYNAVFSEELRGEYAKCLTDHFLCDTLFAVAEKGEG
ncbi:MAG TPA: methyltransferase domain-containing protein [Methanomicrobiales archaeon]|nr:methyltransferase domain-containing protein [Methanomicrobiales archaeon]